MFLRQILLCVIGVSAGLIVSAGVFTVLISVGLIPRFAGKMHVARKIFALEEMVVFGTLAGGFCSIFSDWSMMGEFVRTKLTIRRRNNRWHLGYDRYRIYDLFWTVCRYLCGMPCARHCRDA